MNEEVPGQCVAVLGESNTNNEPQRRRSARLTSPPQNVSVVDKMAPMAAVKRSIVVRKIQPRKTTAVMPEKMEEHHNDEENEQQQRMSEGSASSQTNSSGKAGAAAVKRSIIVRKIEPRKTAAVVVEEREHNNNDENEQRMSEGSASSQTNSSGKGAAAVKRSIVVRKIEPRKTAAVVLAAASEEEHSEEQQRLSEGSILRKRPKPSIPDPGPTVSPRPRSEKRSIVVRKITSRKTSAARASEEEHNKENEEQRLSEGGRPLLKKTPNISTPDPGPVHRAHSLKKTSMPSPILYSPPCPSAPPQPTAADPLDVVWSTKVRRSYSRLSDQSIHSPPSSRDNLFGFDNLKTPEVIRKPSKTVLDNSKSLSAVNSFTSWLEGDDCSTSLPGPAPDLDIPGVVMVKEKRRRNKVQKIDLKEVDELAAKMNAEFDAADSFDLFVE